MPEEARKPRGRPLDPEIDDAIVNAAVKQFLELGLQRLTVPGVAAAAGVAKTTVYRRYATPAQLALAAIDRLNAGRRDSPTPARRAATSPRCWRVVRQRIDPTLTATVLVEAQTHPEVLEAAREKMISPAVERFRRVLRRGVERGELHADLDVDRAADAFLGSFFTHFYERGRPGPGWPEEVVSGALPGADGQGGIRTRDGAINPILA